MSLHVINLDNLFEIFITKLSIFYLFSLLRITNQSTTTEVLTKEKYTYIFK